MVPIFAMASAALLVALYKWLSLAFLRKPSQKKIGELLEAVGRRDAEAVRRRVAEIKGPVGRMLAAGVENIRETRELIEEVMYETVLTTRLRLQRLLPFIAICAASAPLLGLLGTVTGIISTFKLITVFGSGDVKTLSGGISEALITTEFGLIVAIPSLLLHAFLSRKARGVIGQMETAAVAFANQVSKTAGVSASPAVAEGDGRVEPLEAPVAATPAEDADQALLEERNDAQAGELNDDPPAPGAVKDLDDVPATARGTA
jgi:biopolymer transport protein ExbB